MFDPALKAVIIYENHPIILKMKSMFPACETFNVNLYRVRAFINV